MSTHVAGKRLSAFFNQTTPRPGISSAVVGAMVSQVLRALTVLQSKGPGISHGAISPDRVLIDTNGQICVLEHVLGSALGRLNLSAAQLWRQFGIVAAPSPFGTPRLDARTDVFQLAVLALELLLGRRLSRLELEHRTALLLDEWSQRSQAAGEGETGTWLRAWLERALHVGHGAYENAREAYADLRKAPWDSTTSAFESLTADHSNDADPQTLAPADPSAVPALPPRTGGSWRLLPWAAAALAVVAAIEGVALVFLVRRPPPASVAAAAVAPSVAGSVTPRGAPVAPVEAVAAGVAPTTSLDTLSAIKAVPAIEAVSATEAVSAVEAAAFIEAAARRQRSGGVRFATPVELKVLQGETVLGSTADGPIVSPAGTYQLDFINTALGVRVRQAVTFSPGRIVNLQVVVPPGRISVNARPWADVLIDDRRIGETPLANIVVSVGDHEVVFRHPDLGERRQTVTVRSDVTTRVTTSFDQ